MEFVDAIGGSLIFPILSTLFIDNKNGLIIGNSLISRQMLYGLSFALFSLASIVGMPLLGSLSDKYGRKKIIFIGCTLLTFDYLIGIISILLHNVWLFLLGRLFIGGVSGISAVANALIIDLSPNDSGLMSNLKLPILASILGFILGPSLSIFASSSQAFSLSMPFMIGFILSNANLLIFFILFLIFKHPKVQYKKIISPKQRVGIFTTIANDFLFIFNNKNDRPLVYAYLIFQVGICLFIQSLSLYLIVFLHYKPPQISMFFIGMALFFTIGMYILQFLLNKILDQDSQLQLSIKIVLSLFFLGVIVVKWSFIFGSNYILIFGLICGLIYLLLPLLNLNFIRLFTNLGNETNQGRIMGGVGQLSAIGMIISATAVGEITCNAEWIVFIINGISLVFTYIFLKAFLSYKKHNVEAINYIELGLLNDRKI